MSQICQNLPTKKIEVWLLFVNLPRHAVNHQSRRSNPTSMVLVRPCTLIQQQPYILHPFIWINPLQLQPITYTVPNYNYQDTHHQIRVQRTQQHDRKIIILTYTTIAFNPTTTRRQPRNPKTAKAENRSSFTLNIFTSLKTRLEIAFSSGCTRLFFVGVGVGGCRVEEGAKM